MPSPGPNMPGGKVAGVDETSCSSCIPGRVLESKPGLEGPAWRRAPASLVWMSGAPRGSAASLESTWDPNLPRPGRQHAYRTGSDTCPEQVPPAPTPEYQERCFCGFLFYPPSPHHGVLKARCQGSCVHCLCTYPSAEPADKPEKPPVVSSPGFVLTTGRNITWNLSTLWGEEEPFAWKTPIFILVILF